VPVRVAARQLCGAAALSRTAEAAVVATRDSAGTAELGQADATAELELRGSGDDQADSTTEMAFSDSAEAAEAADEQGQP